MLSRRCLSSRWTHARFLGAWNLLFVPLVCLPFVGSGLLIVQGIDLLLPGVPGSVTITGCETTKGGWNCDGRFTATDGSIRIERVRIYPYFPQDDRPSGEIEAQVSGPDATQADADNELVPGPLWGGVLIGLFGLYMLYRFYLQPEDGQSALSAAGR